MIYLYTRPGCHLCEEAKKNLLLLQENSEFKITERNIDERDEWTEKYGLMIPVIALNEQIIDYGNISFPAISEKLQLEINKQLKK